MRQHFNALVCKLCSLCSRLATGEAAHDTGAAKEPQETNEADERETGGGEEQELEEPSRTCRGGLLENTGS